MFTFERVENIVEKRRKCWLPAFSSFFYNVFKSLLLLKGPYNTRLFGKGLIITSCRWHLASGCRHHLENIEEKKNCLIQFSYVFEPYSGKRGFNGSSWCNVPSTTSHNYGPLNSKSNTWLNHSVRPVIWHAKNWPIAKKFDPASLPGLLRLTRVDTFCRCIRHLLTEHGSLI